MILAHLIVDDIADQIVDYENDKALTNKKNFILNQMSDMIQEQDKGDNIRTAKKGEDGEQEDEDY